MPIMRKLAACIVVLAVLLAIGTAPGRADTVFTGETRDGAFYKIVVPDVWNGDLVIWNHGFSLAPLGEVEDLGPFAELQLLEGYAVAASSYRQIGWAVFKTKNDLQNLMDIFKAEVGTPDEVLVTGASLGGLVTAAALEAAHLGNVTGALSLCGAVAGSPNWNGALDLRLIYDAVCGAVPGAFIPGGAEGLPEGFVLDEQDLVFAVRACTGILAPPEARSPAQSANLQRILEEARIPENFLLTNMGYVTFAMSDLVHDPDKLDGRIAVGNEGVSYDDPVIDATIARVAPHPGAAKRLARHYTPTGDVGDVKIVSLHTDKDGLVVVENESAWAEMVPQENLTTAVVVEQVPTHCGFTEAEGVAAWESLRFWVAGGPQPDAASLQLTCEILETQGVSGPCRIDPTFVIPPLDARIRPRG